MNRKQTLLLGAAIAIVIFGIMALTVRSTEAWQSEGAQAKSEEANNISTIVDTLFGKQVIAFEILGILLTAAMIGTLVIARPLGTIPDEANYPQPSKEEAQQALDVSEASAFPAANLEDKQ